MCPRVSATGVPILQDKIKMNEENEYRTLHPGPDLLADEGNGEDC